MGTDATTLFPLNAPRAFPFALLLLLICHSTVNAHTTFAPNERDQPDANLTGITTSLADISGLFPPTWNLVDVLPRLNPWENDTRKELLVSYLAAVSTFPVELFAKLSVVSDKGSKESIDNMNVADTFCFRTDFDGSMISGAIQVAMDEVNEHADMIPGYKMVFLHNNTCGTEVKSRLQSLITTKIGTQFFMDHWRKGAKLFIGPESNCRTEAMMAAAQNLPIISYKCKDEVVSDKKKYPTFARTVPAETEITKALFSVLASFKWRKFTIIYEGSSQSEELYAAIKKLIDSENGKVVDWKYHIQNVSVMPYPFSEVEVSAKSYLNQIIAETSQYTRIYVTFGNVKMFREITFIMGDLNLMDRGDYALIYMNPDYNMRNVYHAMNNHFFRDTKKSVDQSWGPNSPEYQLVNYSRSAFAIIPTPVDMSNPSLKKFWEKSSSYLPYFGVNKDLFEFGSIMANRIACYLYDAVLLYAHAINEILKDAAKQGKNTTVEEIISNGEKIIRKILGKKYSSIQGFDMRIDENGNAQGNYTLLSLQPVLPITDPSSTDYYPLSLALTPTADFVADDNATDTLPTIRFQREITWLGGQAPVDEPECGFYGEKCVTDGMPVWKKWTIFLGVLLTIVTTVIIVLLWRSRSRRLEKELANIWRVDVREIKISDENHASANSLILPDESLICLLVEDGERLGTHDKFRYKSQDISIKQIRLRRAKEPTRTSQGKLKSMCQLHHDNINRFFGLIVGHANLFVVRDFCAKHSLMEILSNRDLKLEMDFIESFVEDLVKGMIYLHDSDVKIHGNLKSTNCLITSRWALRVADFGLNEFRDGEILDCPEEKWQRMLWTAPELLRQSDLSPYTAGTQKGDVYAFGIILHEMMSRRRPYDVDELDYQAAEEVVRLVHGVHDQRVYRPSLENLTCQPYVLDAMEMCWAESAQSRPDFRGAIRQKLKPMFADVSKKNVVDQMMKRMEKYQLDLEELVSERTAELFDEKRRTEKLLQRMLPYSVAQQLLGGGDVKPEYYSSVTIYFSDIVGFTTISHESTPMQVVAFLNKLYTLFDSIIQQYDVYKVETIGDAYMVVSGVPENKDEIYHAEQIGMMALHLLSAVENFEIPHMPQKQLKLRIGIHTGPCVAGVVGKTMPRYCLFGDSVNVASRMESNGEALRIHCSETTKKALVNVKGFQLEERGTLQIKGKGMMTTYWLHCRDGVNFKESCRSNLADEHLSSDIFPRSSVRHRHTSQWAVNKGSCLSLHWENGMKRMYSRVPNRIPIGSVAGGGSVPTLENVPESSTTNASTDSQRTLVAFSKSNTRKSTMQSCFIAKSVSSVDTAVTDDYYNMAGRTAEGVSCARKRSSSMPDAEYAIDPKRFLRYLRQHNRFEMHAGPNSPSASPNAIPRKNAIAYLPAEELDALVQLHCHPNETARLMNHKDALLRTPQRTPTASNDKIVPRKRSLSFGDKSAAHDEQDRLNYDASVVVDPKVALISDGFGGWRKRFYKERKSVLSLQQNFERDTIASKKPFWHPSLHERSPGGSLNRLWRRLTNTIDSADQTPDEPQRPDLLENGFCSDVEAISLRQLEKTVENQMNQRAAAQRLGGPQRDGEERTKLLLENGDAIHSEMSCA